MVVANEGPGFRFRRRQRLTAPAHFRQVYAHGQVFRGPGLKVRVARRVAGTVAEHARLGVAIRRGTVRTSVARNRWRRWVREAFRTHPEATPRGCDVVVQLVQPVPTRYQDVEQPLVTLLRQAQETLSR